MAIQVALVGRRLPRVSEEQLFFSFLFASFVFLLSLPCLRFSLVHAIPRSAENPKEAAGLNIVLSVKFTRDEHR